MANVAAKVCVSCKELKSTDEWFWVDRATKDGFGCYCKPCTRIKQSERYHRDLEKSRAKARAKTYTERGQRTRRNYRLMRKYGITLDQYESMLRSQRDKCRICRQVETRMAKGKVTSLVVDHCHQTDKVRGLLCHNCNAALGMINDDIGILNSMLEYLVKHGR